MKCATLRLVYHLFFCKIGVVGLLELTDKKTVHCVYTNQQYTIIAIRKCLNIPNTSIYRCFGLYTNIIGFHALDNLSLCADMQ